MAERALTVDRCVFEDRVYGILGVPVGTDDQTEVLDRIRKAIVMRRRLMISTLNINFVVIARKDEEFRRSLYASDLCTVDGAPLFWILRILGVRIGERVTGSDLFDTLLKTSLVERRVRLALFGGPDGAAQQAATQINRRSDSVECVCAISPGFASIADLSTDELLAAINGSDADFLSVSLGASKGQLWLLRNDTRLSVPVRVHLGAVINFQAGKVARAPKLLRRLGMEWLWRIKEEPQLFTRYWKDGWIFLYLLTTKVMPLAAELKWSGFRFGRRGLAAELEEADDHVRVVLTGAAVEQNLGSVKRHFVEALARNKCLVLDLTRVDTADPRFMGVVLTLSNRLDQAGLSLKAQAASSRVRRQFRLNGFGPFLEEKLT